MKHFVFLEILDPDFNYFYETFAEIVTGIRPRKPPHLTVRGPYDSPISAQAMQSFNKGLGSSVLEISSVGRFSNHDEEVVYLKVSGGSLRSIWWKPDYPISKFGYNPHISLYRGDDHWLAEKLERFGPLRRVKFLCAEYRLVTRVSSKDVYRRRTGYPIASNHLRPLLAGHLAVDFFERLEALKTMPEVFDDEQIPLLDELGRKHNLT